MNHIVLKSYYVNMLMQYMYIEFSVSETVKIKNKSFDIFYFYYFNSCAQNIDCGYQLEPPHRGGSNGYPQSMFLSESRYTPAFPSFAI